MSYLSVKYVKIGQYIYTILHNFDDILQAIAKSGNYVMGQCQSEHYLQLSVEYFVKSFSIPE